MSDARSIKRVRERHVLLLSAAISIACSGCGEIAFLNGGVLIFGAACAVPVIIHLLFRRRPRMVKFPAVRFIRRSKQATSRRFQLKHLMLLLVRVLLILLFVLIMARPYVKSQQTVVKGKARVKAVLVFDDSFSMGYLDRKVSRLDEAKRLALQVLGAFDVGSEVAVVKTSEKAGSFTMDLERVRQQIGDLRLTARGDPCWGAVGRAQDLLKGETTLPREIYVFSDMTRHAWQTTEKLRDSPLIHWCFLDVGRKTNENISIHSVTVERRTLSVNKPTRITATVAAEAGGPRAVALTVDGEKRSQQELDLKDRLSTCRFEYTCREVGLHFGTIALVGDDPLEIDNRRHFLMDVRPPVEVLCVCESEDDAFYLTNALNPEGESKQQRVKPVCIRTADLAGKDLGTVQSVFLINVKQLDPGQATKLANYVSDGGGLIIFGGGRMDLKEFAPKDSGLVFATELEITEATQGLRLQPGDYSHPVLESFRGGKNGDLALPRFCTYLSLLPGSMESRARTILTFDNGVPALLEGDLGTGRILLFTSSIAAQDADEWNNLPKCPCFVPFIHEILDYTAHYQEGPADVGVGETVLLRAPESAPDRQVEVMPPGKARTINVPIDTTRSFAVFRETQEPGGYTAILTAEGEKEKRGFVVNVDPEESDLGRIDLRQIEAAMPGVTIRVARTSDDLKTVERELRIGRELGHVLLWPLLLLMVLEVVMGNTFYRD